MGSIVRDLRTGAGFGDIGGDAEPVDVAGSHRSRTDDFLGLMFRDFSGVLTPNSLASASRSLLV